MHESRGLRISSRVDSRRADLSMFRRASKELNIKQCYLAENPPMEEKRFGTFDQHEGGPLRIY